MDLHSAGHRRGVVCAPQGLAGEAGRAVLVEGGNAVEAMIAMAATIAVTYPHMNGIGGDGFWLVRERSGKIRALMAPGAAGAKARPELYRNSGYEMVPSRGPLAALTVPGAISGWMLAQELAKAQGGRLPLGVLLADAIRHAGEGFAMSRSQAAATAATLSELKEVPGFADAFLAEGKAPAQGAKFKQPALAATLEQLVSAGLEDFYRGDVGREIAADLDRVGSPVTRADLERCRGTVAEPLSVTLQAGTLYNTPLPTPGLVALIILAVFERLGFKEADGFDHIHGLVEATKRALAVRDGYVTDPARQPMPPDRFLSDAFLDAQARAIDRAQGGAHRGAGREGRYHLDGRRRCVGHGRLLHPVALLGVRFRRRAAENRRADAEPRHELHARSRLEPAQPGRLPLHTLNPALAVLRDGRVMAYGCMGGDAQPQIQAELFSRHVLYGQPLEQALDRPRWLIGRTWGSAHSSLVVEGRVDGNVIDRLVAAGHDVTLLAEPYVEMMGHAGAVVLHPDGTLEGGHDPRADGGAAGV